MSMDANEFLSHHGVKGQKWGVRHLPFGSTKGSVAKNVHKNQMRWLSKFGVSRKTKEELAIGLGTVFVGVLMYGATKKFGVSSKEVLAGEKISKELFQARNAESQLGIWGPGFNNAPGRNTGAFEGMDKIPELHIPKGTMIHRFSYTQETRLGSNAYSILGEDQAHYLTQWSSMRSLNRNLVETGSTGMHHLSFSSTKDVRIPTLEDAAKCMQETLNRRSFKKTVSLDKAYEELKTYVGGEYPKEFQKTMLSRGFGGIRDYMDTGVIGDNPIVLFGGRSVGKISSKEISSNDLRNAENSVTELLHRRGIPTR